MIPRRFVCICGTELIYHDDPAGNMKHEPDDDFWLCPRCMRIHKQSTKLQIKTVQELKQAARDRRAVICPNAETKRLLKKPCAAAYVINFSGHLLAMLFSSGMYIYEKNQKGKGDG